MKNNFNFFQNLKFNALDDSVNLLFKTGNLNPNLLSYYLGFPERYLIFNNPKLPVTLFAIKEMEKDLIEMKHICEANNCSLIFVNLPISIFVNQKIVGIPYFDIVYKTLRENNKIDSIYKSVAYKVGIPYFEMTNRFLTFKDKSKYYYKYDTHPNQNGYEEMAKGISDYLINDYKIKTQDTR
jgi:hypothetical protein